MNLKYKFFLISIFTARTLFGQLSYIGGFGAGTTVILAQGAVKPIEKITLGDYLLSVNLDKKDITIDRVMKIDSFYTEKVMDLKFSDGTTIVCSHECLFYVKNKGWSSFKPEHAKLKTGTIVNLLEIGDSVVKCKPILKRIGPAPEHVIHPGDSVYRVKLISINEVKEKTKLFQVSMLGSFNNFFANNLSIYSSDNYFKNIKEFEIDSIRIYCVDPHYKVNEVLQEEDFVRKRFSKPVRKESILPDYTITINDKKTLEKIKKNLNDLKKIKPISYGGGFRYRIVLDIYCNNKIKVIVSLADRQTQLIEFNSDIYNRFPKLYRNVLHMLPKEYRKGIIIRRPHYGWK